MFQQVLRNLFVDFKLSRIDDAHVEASFDAVVQESRVDGFTNDVVAAKTEAHV